MNCTLQAARRAGFYFDGFNLYHAIDGLKQPHLKWLNLYALAELIASLDGVTLVSRVVYCSAYKRDNFDKLTRHQKYVDALKLAGVDVRLGHFIGEPNNCRQCGHTWQAPSEKESDVNLALAVLDDAYTTELTDFYLVTADSDQGATAKMFKARFPNKRLVSVVPPGQAPSKSIATHAAGKISVQSWHIERSLFLGGYVLDSTGTPKVKRPDQYNPPAGWTAPQASAPPVKVL
jgi:hypothetical protein